jgi:hypothetical protein
MASTWAATASNETISFNNLQNAVDTGVFAQKATIPVSDEQITKDDANTYVYINTLFGPFASKSSNQLVVKSNMECISPVFNTQDFLWNGIANNETTSSPIQLIAGLFSGTNNGRIYKSTDYGINYSVTTIFASDALMDIKYMPAFRYGTSTIIPFLAVGLNGRMLINGNVDCSIWFTGNSPTVQDLYSVAFNSAGVGIVVGNQRIIKTDTNFRIDNWSIVNSVASLWRSVASNGSRFVAVGNNSSILAGASNGTAWSTGTMPPLAPPTITLRGVTSHSDSFWYAVGFTATGSPYIMKSIDSFGFNWETYSTTGDSFIDALYSISSINGRLVVGGLNYQYQITGGVVTRCGANTGGVSMRWNAIVKDANSSSGFDMAGSGTGTIGAYSVF